jgi:preprotein translocase subunit YajC
MHSFLILLVHSATTPTTAAKSSKSSGSSQLTLIFIVVLFALAYFLFIRPRTQKMRQQQTGGRQQLSIGDAVMTAGGIYGTVVAMDSEVVEVEVSPGVVMTFVRRAVNPRPGAPATSDPTPNASDEAWDGPAAIGDHDLDDLHDLPDGPDESGPARPGPDENPAA